MPRVQPAERSVGKIPLARVEAESEVDHHCGVTCCIARCATRRRMPRRLILHGRCPRGTKGLRPLIRLAKKNRLPPIRVARPFVEHQHAQKIGEVAHPRELLIGQKIVDRHARGVPWKLRTELFPRGTRCAPETQLNRELRRVGDQLRADVDHFDLRHGEPQPRPEPRNKHFVRQNPQILRIVLEFDDVVRTVVAAHQMGLRPAPHPPHVLEGQPHGRHSIHARRAPQENCSTRGIKIADGKCYTSCAGKKQFNGKETVQRRQET